MGRGCIISDNISPESHSGVRAANLDGVFLHRLSLSGTQRDVTGRSRSVGGGVRQVATGKVLACHHPPAVPERRFKQNIDAIRSYLQGKRKLTFSIFLFYAFSPLPSNYLFIAYGLTNMELKLIAIPFFLGRSVSYAFWGQSSAAASRWLGAESSDVLSYLSVYFIGSQALILYLIYLFTRVDWRTLLDEHRLRIVRRKPLQSGAA